ncbi:hypothetical protein F53441_2039 [Fusarium austroafricanum]|uniref:Uncharacterized protein n=1 Tax=Fusarium austroafricanum TaxID=2364996 RepID=A0A8H4P1I1_9HYPO|nr:hypothetical protein F53441_2039 [Fusarium austroafricanum]
MSPPPSTPTPRRFLLPKRGTQSSQNPATLPRFQSTPRFASSSVPRPTQARTGVDIEDVEEVGDDLQEHLQEIDDDQISSGKHGPLHDSIEIESDDTTLSQDGLMTILDNEPDIKISGSVDLEMFNSPTVAHESSPIEERESKRRRVSISPIRESSPLEEQHSAINDGPEDIREENHTPTESSMQSFQDAISPNGESKALQQPTFRAPPRFKPVEIDPAVEGLPAAFSPQRRGAKYIAAGLAAELQGWLSEVKGWGGATPTTGSTEKVTVEEIRPGRRMYLIKGRTDKLGSKRYLLAGEGRLTGLGYRTPMNVGSVVEVGQPAWDIDLEGHAWTVACDWRVS